MNEAPANAGSYRHTSGRVFVLGDRVLQPLIAGASQIVKDQFTQRSCKPSAFLHRARLFWLTRPERLLIVDPMGQVLAFTVDG